MNELIDKKCPACGESMMLKDNIPGWEPYETCSNENCERHCFA